MGKYATIEFVRLKPEHEDDFTDKHASMMLNVKTTPRLAIKHDGIIEKLNIIKKPMTDDDIALKHINWRTKKNILYIPYSCYELYLKPIFIELKYELREPIPSIKHVLLNNLPFQTCTVPDENYLADNLPIFNKLYGYQKDIVYSLCDASSKQVHGYQSEQGKIRRFLLALEQGLGKSILSLAIMMRWRQIDKNTSATKTILILSPASVTGAWYDTIQTFLPNCKVQCITKTNKIQPFNDCDFVILSYKRFTLIKEIVNYNYYGVIIDEYQNLKNRTTNQTKAILPVIKSRCKAVLFLSGTPALNRPAELYVLFHSIFLDKMRDPQTRGKISPFRHYAFRYCKGYMRDKLLIATGANNMDELCSLFELISIRLIKSDVAKYLPKRNRIKIVIENSLPQFNQAIEKLRHDATLIKNLHMNGQMVEQQSILQCFNMTSEIKINSCIKYIQDHILNNIQNNIKEQIIVFYFHQEFGNRLQEILQESTSKFIRIDGSTPQKKRQPLIDEFLKYDDSIAVLSISACNAGLSMPNVKTMFFVELTWSPAILQQCEARSHRITSKGADNNYIYFCLEGSLDSYIYDIMLPKKTKILNQIYRSGDNDVTISEKKID